MLALLIGLGRWQLRRAAEKQGLYDAFAAGVGNRLPVVGVPLHALAGVVAYSQVHTGVHHPSDVVVGSVLGTVLAQLTTRALEHLHASS